MLISTAFFVGDDVDSDERYREFRDMTIKSGDLTSLAIAMAYGTVLLRAEESSHDEAIDVLERARTNIEKHRVFTFVLVIIDTDLAIDAAHMGRRDAAIDELRALVSLTRAAAVESSSVARQKPWWSFSSSEDLWTISPSRTESWMSGRYIDRVFPRWTCGG